MDKSSPGNGGGGGGGGGESGASNEFFRLVDFQLHRHEAGIEQQMTDNSR